MEELLTDVRKVLAAVDYIGLSDDQVKTILDGRFDDIVEENELLSACFAGLPVDRKVAFLILSGVPAGRLVHQVEDYLVP